MESGTFGASRDTAYAMSQEKVEIVRRWWAGFNKDGFPPLDLCDADVEVRIPREFPFTGIYHGHEGVRKWAEEVFDVIEDHRVEIQRVFEAPDDETVVMALRSTGRTKEMSFEADMAWAALWVIRDGKLVYAQGYLAMDEALEAAGLSE
jgi:ketosteroid isomerase-like protein